MTVVLLAVDETDESINAAREARALFGPDATYLAVNVADQAPGWASMPTAWGAVYAYPYAAPYPLIDDEVAAAVDDEAAAQARDTAQAVAAEAGVEPAAAVGEVGDPTQAILDAAAKHHADVIVVGATHKGWWRRLIDGSVSAELARRSELPILIAGHAPPTDS